MPKTQNFSRYSEIKIDYLNSTIMIKVSKL